MTDTDSPWYTWSLQELAGERDYWLNGGSKPCSRQADRAYDHAVRHGRTEVVVIRAAADTAEDLDDAMKAIAPESIIVCVDGDRVISAGSDAEQAAIVAWCNQNVEWDR